MSKRKEKMVTVVCCYNDSGQYERFCASLEKQSIEYKLLGIDNRGQRFSSCSSALNSVIRQIESEYVIYSHQDVELPETDMLERFLSYLGQIGDADILGAAGAAETKLVLQETAAAWAPAIGDAAGTCVLSHIRHGSGLSCAGEVEFEGLLECDTVDECFFGGRTETFRSEPFDERLCDNWHLYAVERCLRARVQGNKVWVCAFPLLHHSGGKINHAYNENFRRIAAYYANLSTEYGNGTAVKLRYIRTVCGSTQTDWLHRNLFYWKRELLFLLHRL